MPKALWERLRAARGAEVLAALALLALLALILLNNGGSAPADTRTALEVRLERILSTIDGAGNARAMVAENEDGDVVGAVIVAEGEMNVSTCLEIQSAVTTLLEIDVDRVEIIFANGE